MQLLTEEFLSRYPDYPAHMTPLGQFVYLRTYSRYLPELGRRETWKETVRRATEYNVGLELRHRQKLGLPIDMEALRAEAELLFDNMFNLRQFLSGRTLWVGGAANGLADKYPLANFNCSYLSVRSWDDLGDMFYLLLVGTGVGFRCTKDMARSLPPVRNNVKIIHSDYNPLPPNERLEHTKLVDVGNGYAKMYIGDSKEGWVEALRYFLDVHTKPEYEHIHTLKISYNSVRPKGERLKTFGGTASGPEPLRTMFDGIARVFRNEVDPTLDPLEPADKPGYYHLRPIHVLDIGNFIGQNVVVGGVRRTAEIFLFDADDYESLWAKVGINGYWKEADFRRLESLIEYCHKHHIPYPKRVEAYLTRYYDPELNKDFITGEPRRESDGSLSPFNLGSGLYHRAMSNNSVVFTRKPSREFLHFLFLLLQCEGEPGFVNLEEAARRRIVGMGMEPKPELIDQVMQDLGLNPCAEVLLDTYGVCNLTTVNVTQFVVEKDGRKVFDYDGFERAQRLSARCGLRMTLVDLELPHWDAKQKRDRLLGTSLTGFKDAMADLGGSEEEEADILQFAQRVAREEAERFARELRVNVPLLVTTVKPEGTLSQVAGGVSPGLHWSHSPYYIRRIRINANDPLAKAVLALGWHVMPENGTPGDTLEERMRNAHTYVVSFPVKSPSKVTKEDITIDEQFRTYLRFQWNYTEHNSSNTITVKPHEWARAEELVWKHWDNFVGVTFLPHDGGTYQQAPYEACTEEVYNKLNESMKPLTPDFLALFETSETDLDIGTDGCASGACPIR